MEDDRVTLLEEQLAQAKLIAEEADKKYEEVVAPSLYPLSPPLEWLSRKFSGNMKIFLDKTQKGIELSV